MKATKYSIRSRYALSVAMVVLFQAFSACERNPSKSAPSTSQSRSVLETPSPEPNFVRWGRAGRIMSERSVNSAVSPEPNKLTRDPDANKKEAPFLSWDGRRAEAQSGMPSPRPTSTRAGREFRAPKSALPLAPVDTPTPY